MVNSKTLSSYPNFLAFSSGTSSTVLTAVFSLFLFFGFMFFGFYQMFLPPATLVDAASKEGYVIIVPEQVTADLSYLDAVKPKQKKSDKNPMKIAGVDVVNPMNVGHRTSSVTTTDDFGLDEISYAGKTKALNKTIDDTSENVVSDEERLQQERSALSHSLKDERDSMVLIDHVMSYADDVISHKAFDMKEYSPLADFVMPEPKDASDGKLMYIDVNLAKVRKNSETIMVQDIKGIVPEATVVSHAEFFGTRMQVLQDIADKFFLGMMFVAAGLLAFLIVMARSLFNQHARDTQSLAYLGAEPRLIRTLYFNFFQTRFLIGLSFAVVLGSLVLAVLSFGAGMPKGVMPPFLDLVVWVGFFSIVAGALFFGTLETLLRRRVAALA